MQNSKLLDKKSEFDKFYLFFKDWCPLLSKEVAYFMVAQAALETGWFTSNVFKKCKNLFGMRMPKKRITTADGSKLNHASYLTIYYSFVDYLLWLASFGFSQSDLKDFDAFVAKFRKTPFNPSEIYCDTILKIIKLYAYE